MYYVVYIKTYRNLKENASLSQFNCRHIITNIITIITRLILKMIYSLIFQLYYRKFYIKIKQDLLLELYKVKRFFSLLNI